jgi:hypothetical protein
VRFARPKCLLVYPDGDPLSFSRGKHATELIMDGPYSSHLSTTTKCAVVAHGDAFCRPRFVEHRTSDDTWQHPFHTVTCTTLLLFLHPTKPTLATNTVLWALHISSLAFQLWLVLSYRISQNATTHQKHCYKRPSSDCLDLAACLMTVSWSFAIACTGTSIIHATLRPNRSTNSYGM